MVTESEMRLRQLAGTFHDVPRFAAALDALLAAGFPREAVSVLAAHQALQDHFGDDIPPPSVMADRPNTPRENLADQGAVETAIHWLAEGLASIGMLGAAGVAFAVGGPVGLAAVAGDSAEQTVERVLGDHVEAQHQQSFQDSVAEGGVICWVEVRDDAEEARARDVLSGHGAQEVHVVDPT